MDRQWGGSRPGNQSGKRGGARPGSGPIVRRIQLDKERAGKLRELMMNQRTVTGNQEFSENEMVAALIDAAYNELK